MTSDQCVLYLWWAISLRTVHVVGLPLSMRVRVRVSACEGKMEKDCLNSQFKATTSA